VVTGDPLVTLASNCEHLTPGGVAPQRPWADDAKLKVRLHDVKCPQDHPLAVRQSGTRFFLGCENYPACGYTGPLSILEGT
jgi:hypothetical protein